MNVTRVQTPSGSHIEPGLNDSWDDLTKLRWKAALTAEDTNHAVPIDVEESNYSTKTLGRWIRNRGYYDITVGNSQSGPHNFRGAWDYLNGVQAGINAILVTA